MPIDQCQLIFQILNIKKQTSDKAPMFAMRWLKDKYFTLNFIRLTQKSYRSKGTK